ncbi:MAG: hypothetical protein HYS53_02290 [Candidatus Aenigmarchaeota archaeon]|nr:hypothetical protein [Candidatus Aenigmarchaeota archaeon]
MCLQDPEREALKKLLARALNKNQILILSELDENFPGSVSSFLSSLSSEQNIPLSTLKLNAKVLKRLGLVEFSENSAPITTEAGKFVLIFLRGEINER